MYDVFKFFVLLILFYFEFVVVEGYNGKLIKDDYFIFYNFL